MFTAPTALRAIRKDDPENKHITQIGEQGGLRSLRAMFLAGERSEPAIIHMYEKLMAKYGDDKIGGARVIDNWWSSESGSPISGLSMAAHVVQGTAPRPPLAIKPGSAGKPMPGFDVRVVDDEGNEVEKGKMGNIVLKMPLAPTAFRTLWEDEKRFYSGYLKRFEGKWLDTGDAGIIDPEGYVHIMARSGKLCHAMLVLIVNIIIRNICVLILHSQTISSTSQPTDYPPAHSNKQSHPTHKYQKPASSPSQTPSKAPFPLLSYSPPLRANSTTPSSSPRSRSSSAPKSAPSPRSAA